MRGAYVKRVGPAGHWWVITVVVAVGLIAAACGGSSKKGQSSTNTTASSQETTTSVASDTTTTTGETTSSVAAPAVTTATTTKPSTSATTRKPTTTKATAPKALTNVAGGINNVTAAPTTAAPTNIQPGGTITYAKTGDIASVDPTKIANQAPSDGVIADSLYDMLVYNDVTTGTIVPQTAESITSSDALTWTLKLRPNIKFSDGTAYDANAVKFNYLRLQDPANSAVRATQANLIANMTVADPQTLVFTLKSKNALFPGAMTLIPFIASPAAIQAQGSKYGSDANAVGAGPFLLKSWQRDSQYVFVRNPTYWRAPQPYVDQLIINPIADETQRINTFMSGGANFTTVGLGTNADLVQKNGGVNHPMILNGGLNIYFNTRTKPFNDIRARQAIGLALDPKDYAKVVNSNLQEPIDSAFRHDSPFYDPTITEPFNDPTKAQQLIDQVAAANGGTFSFTMTAFASTNYQLSALYVQSKLNTYNHMHVDVVTESSALHNTSCPQGQFAQACGYADIWDDPEPTWTGLYTCNASPSRTGWCNAQFDKDVADNQQTLNAQQRIADIKDAQKQFYAEVPTLYLERRYSWAFTTPNIQNFKYTNDGLPLIGEWWIKTHG